MLGFLIFILRNTAKSTVIFESVPLVVVLTRLDTLYGLVLVHDGGLHPLS